MAWRARDHVPLLTGILSVASLGLVFGAVGGLVPSTWIPRAPARFMDLIPHLNALISLAAIAIIATGWRSIRTGRVHRHRRSMLTGFALFVTFLCLYLYKVTLEGPTEFPAAAPDILYLALYLPILAIHILLAMVCVPLLYYVLLLAWSRPIEQIPASNHPRIGRIAATLWLISFALGLVVYAMLYLIPFG